MEVKSSKYPYAFQTDSEIVKSIYNNEDNYLIQFNEEYKETNKCVIYFSSNDIYFPNQEKAFTEKIIDKNFFEWYGTRIKYAHKHILIRDVFKQWYLSGINKQINTPEKLVEFLKIETQGYEVVSIGSSAGGYASVLYGSLLNAKRAIVFNAQFEIKTLLWSSNQEKDPLIFRYQELPVSKYYDLKPLINKNLEIFYFTSANSKWDSEQCEHIQELDNVKTISFNTNHHGIPFLKSALETVINLDDIKLKKFTKSQNNPIWFTIAMIGLINTLKGAKKQLLYKYKKKNK